MGRFGGFEKLHRHFHLIELKLVSFFGGLPAQPCVSPSLSAVSQRLSLQGSSFCAQIEFSDRLLVG
jgi:hypothetical protein